MDNRLITQRSGSSSRSCQTSILHVSTTPRTRESTQRASLAMLSAIRVAPSSILLFLKGVEDALTLAALLPYCSADGRQQGPQFSVASSRSELR